MHDALNGVHRTPTKKADIDCDFRKLAKDKPRLPDQLKEIGKKVFQEVEK